MARKKKPLFGVNTYIRKRPRKRPKRHAKKPNKHSRRKKSRGQGKKRVL
tara:strand:+ start:219 stop:365 length:147 start_codon:yes stop_codon:yes gene_type:complete